MAQQQSSSSGKSQEDYQSIPDPAPAAAAAQTNTSGLDNLLDEIDTVLETNAEEFVKGFVQKGGE